jgi:asparagine synthase (glutamine-hydrolysing)
MCGIAGYYCFTTPIDHTQTLNAMGEAVSHRGPDDAGIWFDKDNGVGLAHRRLSIIDLSNEGHQPMMSHSGRYMIVYNGEIYNFSDIRCELDSGSTPWRGHSDTEVLLSAIDAWGIDSAIKRFVGMFAFALWDRQERVLLLCRDRLGIKPLYYSQTACGVVFGSELKAIKAHPEFRPEIDRDALTLYLRHNCIPAPYTIYRNTWKIRPGNILRISSNDLRDSNLLSRSYCYWDARCVAESGQNNLYHGSDDEAIYELEAVLLDAVKKRMISDVPLGAFLSGGIDSSTIVSLMQAQSDRPVKTFSIGSESQGYNEATYAKEVALHLGTEHTELYLSDRDIMDVIPQLPALFDEPFSDSSQIPTYLVSKLARQQVTVCLSGDGGDELFGGYNRHIWGPKIWQLFGWMHPALRSVVANSLLSVSTVWWNDIFYIFNRFIPANKRLSRVGDNLHKFAEILPSKSLEQMYRGLCSHWKEPDKVVINGTEPITNITDMQYYAVLPDSSHRMMYMDLITYLPDDILTKVDRATMGVSLEGRVPFLDHRVVEFAWRLPLSLKIRNNQRKWILRQVLYKYIPKRLVDRPKMGFGIPIDFWLRGSLRDWAEDLLDVSRMRQEGFFEASIVWKKWKEHISCDRNWQYDLWDILMFQSWLREQ